MERMIPARCQALKRAEIPREGDPSSAADGSMQTAGLTARQRGEDQPEGSEGDGGGGRGAGAGSPPLPTAQRQEQGGKKEEPLSDGVKRGQMSCRGNTTGGEPAHRKKIISLLSHQSSVRAEPGKLLTPVQQQSWKINEIQVMG